MNDSGEIILLLYKAVVRLYWNAPSISQIQFVKES